MKVIVCSEYEVASENMWNFFIDNLGFKETEDTYCGFPTYKKQDFLLVKNPKEIIFIDNLDLFFDPEYYVFASPHSSEANMPCLTVHTTGNFSDNSHGGKEKELGIAPSDVMKSAFLNLMKENKTEFPISLEVTHHGPTNLKKPLLFVEVGSGHSEWKNQNAIETVCRAILGINRGRGVSVIGFGGPHYAPNFTKREQDTELMFGHMCPKYQADHVNEELIIQMIEKTVPKPEKALIDWKGLKGEQRNHITGLLEHYGLAWEKI
jgi:D-aminoacyl-tRNA deacylase